MGGQPTAPARDAWAMIWGDGRASVYPGTADYALLERWWSDEIQALPAINHALEIGAGAMPLPSLCLARCRPGAGIIAGDIRPTPVPPPPPIRWASDVALERLPFADGAFDLVSGQFAFEYAGAGAAVEVRRVLRPGGALRLAVHHHDSRMAQHLADRMTCLHAGAEIEATIARPAAREVRQARLRRALRTLDPLLEIYLRPPLQQDVVDDLLDLHRIVRAAIAGESPSDDDRLLLTQCAPALALAKAQREASLTAEGVDALVAGLRDAGFAGTGVGAIGDERGPLAWGIRATSG